MDFVGIGALIVALLFFGFLAYRAWRAQRLWVKLLGGIPATLLALIFAAATVLAFVGYGKLNRIYPNPVLNLQAVSTEGQLVRGEKFARTCASCHSSNESFPLSGQNFFADGPPIGTLYAPNLTQAHLASWSDGEIVRAIREGIGKDGRSLMIMPAQAFRNMSDEDVLALVAYIRSQPTVEPDTPPRNINLLGAIMLATVFPDSFLTAQPPIAAAVTAPPIGRTPAYGGYLTSFGCKDCHGADMRGNPAGAEELAGSSLVDFAKNHSVEEFTVTLRTGVKPDGTPLEMPWKDFEQYSDDDFAAMYLYVQTLN